MRLPLEWLAEWIDLPPTAELTQRLDLGGFEDTLVEGREPDLSGLRVGRVVERAPHPDADRLSLCRVDVGEGEPLEIVCGAPNVAAGQKVAVATAGTKLPDGTKIKKSKIRGVTSHGMICSARELLLGDEHAGILVLDPEAPVGRPLSEVLPAGAAVLEVGITPNRGDTASLLGLAREVRTLVGGELRLPECTPPEAGPPAAGALALSIEAPEACHRYVARVVCGVRVAPSPGWLVRRLEAAGLRSINNVVDVSNYVLLEFGQPLHCFDLSRLRGAQIRVRRAVAGEKLAMLDGQTRALSTDDLVIADAEAPVALAGVMGGAGSEVNEATRDVLIESAQFDPTCVRLAARRHGLRSEASYRFERGVDREGVRRAADRCARLLAELAGGQVARGALEARGAPARFQEEVRLEAARANRLLGTALSLGRMRELLARAGIESREAEPGVICARIPSHRNDLELPEDLVEEVARIHGYEHIPTTEPLGVLRPVELPRGLRLSERAKDALAAAGLLETVSFPFVAEADLAGLRLAAGDPRARWLRLLNPIRDEEPCLRTSLVPTLLRLVRQNLARQADRVCLFELARVFRAREPGALPAEPLQAAFVLADAGQKRLWDTAPAPLFHRARGVAERLFETLGYVAVLQRDGIPSFLHPGAAAGISVGGEMLGAVGELHPEVAAHFAIDVPCAVCEIDLEALAARPAREPRFHEVSRFPLVRRDLAVLIDRRQPAGEVMQALRAAAGADCVSVEVFDRYDGRGIPEGRVSLAFRLVFQRSDRTLVEADVTPAIERAVEVLSTRFGGELR
jgi:phenylalanyl-tRNA synthetase beta chain